MTGTAGSRTGERRSPSTPDRLAAWVDEQVRPRLYAGARDALNRGRYGPGAPRFAERLWVDPSTVHYYDLRGSFRASARVEGGQWPVATMRSIHDDPIMRTSIARWVDGLAWEETGELQRMDAVIQTKGSSNGCRTREDVVARCRRLDSIFRVIQDEGRVRPQGQVERGTFRELGGIGMHLGPNGLPVRAISGRHRFAMALILKLPTIPVRVGVVHESALSCLEAYRSAGR